MLVRAVVCPHVHKLFRPDGYQSEVGNQVSYCECSSLLKFRTFPYSFDHLWYSLGTAHSVFFTCIPFFFFFWIILKLISRLSNSRDIKSVKCSSSLLLLDSLNYLGFDLKGF